MVVCARGRSCSRRWGPASVDDVVVWAAAHHHHLYEDYADARLFLALLEPVSARHRLHSHLLQRLAELLSRAASDFGAGWRGDCARSTFRHWSASARRGTD